MLAVPVDKTMYPLTPPTPGAAVRAAFAVCRYRLPLLVIAEVPERIDTLPPLAEKLVVPADSTI